MERSFKSLWDVFLSLGEDMNETGMPVGNLRMKTQKDDQFERGSGFISPLKYTIFQQNIAASVFCV